MGNHDVGRGLAASAKTYWLAREQTGVKADPTPAEALAALDCMADGCRGADAEFDDEFAGDTPLSKLVAIAFEATAEERASLRSSDGDKWYDGPYSQFCKRYSFS